jgi:hypothetical protein
MTPAPTGPSPGSLTVPPLFGWEHILLALVLVAAAGVAGLLLLASGRAAGSRNEWQAWLDGRSAQPRERSAGVGPRARPDVRPGDPARGEESGRPWQARSPQHSEREG